MAALSLKPAIQMITYSLESEIRLFILHYAATSVRMSFPISTTVFFPFSAMVGVTLVQKTLVLLSSLFSPNKTLI